VEAGSGLLALPFGPSGEVKGELGQVSGHGAMVLSSAPSVVGDPLLPELGKDRPTLSAPTAGGGLSSYPLDPSNPAAGGQPMMPPMMPMGMGMGGGMGPSPPRERQAHTHGVADAGAWSEPDVGWDVVGRGVRDGPTPPNRPPGSGRAAAERAALDAIDALLIGGSSFHRGGRS
jgi:hypothetical protein